MMVEINLSVLIIYHYLIPPKEVEKYILVLAKFFNLNQR
jgi:hypothetical protein